MLISRPVLAQIDYVNSILASSSYSTIKPYQKVKKCAARKNIENTKEIVYTKVRKHCICYQYSLEPSSNYCAWYTMA